NLAPLSNARLYTKSGSCYNNTGQLFFTAISFIVPLGLTTIGKSANSNSGISLLLSAYAQISSAAAAVISSFLIASAIHTCTFFTFSCPLITVLTSVQISCSSNNNSVLIIWTSRPTSFIKTSKKGFSAPDKTITESPFCWCSLIFFTRSLFTSRLPMLTSRWKNPSSFCLDSPLNPLANALKNCIRKAFFPLTDPNIAALISPAETTAHCLRVNSFLATLTITLKELPLKSVPSKSTVTTAIPITSSFYCNPAIDTSKMNLSKNHRLTFDEKFISVLLSCNGNNTNYLFTFRFLLLPIFISNLKLKEFS